MNTPAVARDHTPRMRAFPNSLAINGDNMDSHLFLSLSCLSRPAGWPRRRFPRPNCPIWRSPSTTTDTPARPRPQGEIRRDNVSARRASGRRDIASRSLTAPAKSLPGLRPGRPTAPSAEAKGNGRGQRSCRLVNWSIGQLVDWRIARSAASRVPRACPHARGSLDCGQAMHGCRRHPWHPMQASAVAPNSELRTQIFLRNGVSSRPFRALKEGWGARNPGRCPGLENPRPSAWNGDGPARRF